MEKQTYTEDQAVNIMLNSFSAGILVGAALYGISYKIGEKIAEHMAFKSEVRKIKKLRRIPA